MVLLGQLFHLRQGCSLGPSYGLLAAGGAARAPVGDEDQVLAGACALVRDTVAPDGDAAVGQARGRRIVAAVEERVVAPPLERSCASGAGRGRRARRALRVRHSTIQSPLSTVLSLQVIQYIYTPGTAVRGGSVEATIIVRVPLHSLRSSSPRLLRRSGYSMASNQYSHAWLCG